MTATRDRHSDLDSPDEPAWDDHPIIGSSRGLPWWGAVVLAFGLTVIAAVIDMQRSDGLGRIFQIAYVVGCVAAIALVRRRSVFTAMVQPPLVFGIAFVGAYLALKDQPPGQSGLKQFALSVGLPLANNFPTMAIATGVAVLIGLIRIFTQRNPERGRPRDQQPDSRGGGQGRPGRKGGPDGFAGPPPDARGSRGEAGPPQSGGRFSRGRGGPDPQARSERPARADRRGQSDPRIGRGERGGPADRPRRPDRGADRGERGGERGAGGRGAGGRPVRDERGRQGGDPRRGGRPQPPGRRPRDDDPRR